MSMTCFRNVCLQQKLIDLGLNRKLKVIKRWTNACWFFIFRRIYLQSENAEPHQSYPLRLKQSLTLREAAFCPQMGGEQINRGICFQEKSKTFRILSDPAFC